MLHPRLDIVQLASGESRECSLGSSSLQIYMKPSEGPDQKKASVGSRKKLELPLKGSTTKLRDMKDSSSEHLRRRLI